MAVEALRIVTDRWEWAALARLAPTVYHEPSWTEASVRRIRAQTSSAVRFGYARIWVADTLIGCPLIAIGDDWFNTPRAVPLVLEGDPWCDPAAAMAAATASMGVTFHDDSDLVSEIVRLATDLADRSTTQRTYRSMSAHDLDTVTRSFRVCDRDRPAARDWVHCLDTTWSSGSWNTEVTAHSDSNGLIGWTAWARRPPARQVIAAACTTAVPEWTSVR